MEKNLLCPGNKYLITQHIGSVREKHITDYSCSRQFFMYIAKCVKVVLYNL